MLKVLMKRKALTDAQKELAGYKTRSEELTKREADLATAIEEAETDEERATVEEAVEEFEADKAEVEGKITELESRIEEIEADIQALEEAQKPAEEPAADPAQDTDETNTRSERGIEIMNKRSIFARMDAQKRARIFEQEDVKSFLGTVRSAITNKRAITGAELTVPEVFLGVLRENVENYSKLYKHVNARQIGGNGTMVVMGTIPEAVWTDCCGVLNELSLTFNDAEVGCWKVAGYFDICNAVIEDSDLDLADEVMNVLGQAIGFALDKAILYGPGTRMPLGVMARLAQTEAPADYPATARPWVDLHTKNVISVPAGATGADLFKQVLLAGGAAKGKYSRGEKVWVMNETTYTKLKAEALVINAAGAIVSGMEGTMPVAGGVVEVLDFVPDNVIIGGYFDLYLLAERAGTKIASSEHAMFIQDRTVFKGTARYDGMPVIAEGFVAIGLEGTTPSAEMTFAPDEANGEQSE